MLDSVTHIVFTGGGFQGLIYIGTLRYLYQEKIDIKNIAGISVGALFATLYALNVSIEEIEEFFFNKFEDLLNESTLTIDVLISRVLTTRGFLNIEHFTEIIKKHIDGMTFVEFTKKTGKNLQIIATHLNTMKPIIFSVDNTPNVLLLEAIQASAAIPLIIAPIRIGNDYYIDGAISCNNIIEIFPNLLPNQIIILHLLFVTDIDENQINTSILYYLKTVLLVYMNSRIHDDPIYKKYPYYIRYSEYPINFLPFIIDDNSNIKLFIDKEKINKSIEIGYEELEFGFNKL